MLVIILSTVSGIIIVSGITSFGIFVSTVAVDLLSSSSGSGYPSFPVTSVISTLFVLIP
ncbi:MAG: hypothetical protein IKN87_01540 [Bacilli bacterium]|nr:hypothetical protein [Bacilli bacterium]